MTNGSNQRWAYAQLALHLEDLPWFRCVVRRNGKLVQFGLGDENDAPSFHEPRYQHNQVWERVPFDPEAHRVPRHAPSRLPVPGCNCAACDQENRGWSIGDLS